MLTNTNSSIQLPIKLPGHVLGMLAAAGLVHPDPLYRYVQAMLDSERGIKHTRRIASARHVRVMLLASCWL
jgi:hypothetical protein